VAYVDRLRSILFNGFHMTTPIEEMRGPTTARLKYQAVVVCFSEVRLSQAFDHAMRYGLLGIAVDRKFVLDSFGGPVHYVRNHSDERVIARTTDMLAWFRDSKATEIYQEAFSYTMSFLKPMSDEQTDNYQYLDENEWRIVATRDFADTRSIRSSSPDRQGYNVLLSPDDVKLVVFPNDTVRGRAAQEKQVADWFRPLGRHPTFITISECLQFWGAS
jgi:hypothetical protein